MTGRSERILDDVIRAREKIASGNLPTFLLKCLDENLHL